MFGIKNISISEKKITHNKEIDDLEKLTEGFGLGSIYAALPSHPWHKVSFELSNTNSSFANAIRSTLIDDLDVTCLDVKPEDIKTDDEFIFGIYDQTIKNINLCPLHQELEKKLDDLDVFLYVLNTSFDIIDVKARDIRVVKKGAAKKYNVDSDFKSELQLFAGDNIVLCRLRPGKYIKINNFTFVTGKQKTSADKFSLLNNVVMWPKGPKGVEPFDQFTKKGVRSIEYDYKDFDVSFVTAGNISPKRVIELCVEGIKSYCSVIEKCILDYETIKDKAFHSGPGYTVNISDGLYTYKFDNIYQHIAKLIAHQCYEKDPSIGCCSATVERYDTEICLIKIAHPDPNKLILSSIKKIYEMLDLILSKF